MKKLKASDFIEIDDEFLDLLEEKIVARTNISNIINRMYTVEQISNATGLQRGSIRRHIKDGWLQAKKIGKTWLISEENYNKYISQDDNNQ